MDGLFALGGLVLFLGWVAAPWVAMARARRAREATETNEQRVHELQRRLTELHKKTQEPKAGQSEQVKDEFDRLRAQVMALQEEKRAWLLERDGLLAALLQAGGKAPEQAAPAEVVEAKVAPDPFAQAEWKKFAQEPLERRAEKALHGEPQHGQQTHQKSAFEHQRKLEKKQQKHAHGEHKHRDAPGDVAAMQARLEDQRKEAEGQPPLELQEVPAQAQVIEAVPVEALKPATPKVPPRPPPPPKGPSAGERARERWRSQVRPILLENVGWFIGGFLVIAGSIYFIQEAWGGFQALGRHILLVAVALAYAGAFVGVGVWFKSKYNLNTASHAMATVGLCLLPVAMISAADIYSAGWLPWAIGAPIAWGLAYPIAYLGAGLLDRTLARQLGFAIWSLLALIVSARAAGALSPALALGLPYLGWVIAHRASSEPLHGAKPPQTSALGFHLAALAYTLAFLIGLSRVVAGDVAGIPWAAATGPLAVLVAFTALRVDVELRARWDKAPELDTALILAFCSAVGGVTATAGSPPIFALAAALASALMAVALVWFRLRLFVLLAIGAATLSLWALLFLSPPMATLLPQLGGALAALTGLDFFRNAATFAFLLLPIVHGARALARRFELRDEPRLAGAARLSAWLVLFAVIAVGSFTSDVRGAAPTLLVCALVLFAWHRQKPGRLTAWSATLALTAGLLLLLLALGRSPADALVKTALVLAAMSLANLPRPGLRIGSAALLQAALAVSAVSLFLDVGNGPAEVLPHLWLTAGLWMLAGLAHGATGMGFIGLAALGGAVAWTLTGLTAWPAFTPALARDPTLPRLLIVPAIYVGIGMGGQWLARHWRGLAPLPFGKTPLEDRVRSLHALSIPALLLATPVLLALTVGALASAIVTANGPAAWMLATLGLLFLVHAYTSRQALTSVLGTIALVAAASIGLSDMLAPTFRAWLINPTRDTQPDLPINVSDGGLSAVAALVLWRAFSWKRAPRYRRLQTAGVRTAMVLFYLAHAAAFVTALGSLAPLFGQPAARPNELRLAEYALLMLLGAGAAQLALRQTLGELSRWFALVSLLFAGALLPEAIGLPPTLVAPVYGGLAIALTLAARLGAFEKARDLFPPARIGAALAAALALTTSFLPPQTPFVAPGFWHHVASDALLCAWLGTELWAFGGVWNFHLLLMALALFATRARMTLGIPSQGAGMIPAAAALLWLGAWLKKKPRFISYGNASLGWAVFVAVVGFARMTLGSQAWIFRFDLWPWAIGAALVMIAIAPHVLTQPMSILGAAALALAAILTVWGHTQPTFLLLWPLWLAGLGLAFALLAVPVRMATGRLAALFAPEPLADALRAMSLLLFAAPGLLALVTASGVLLRLPFLSISPLFPLQLAVVLGLSGASVAVLLWSEVRERAIEVLLATALLCACVLATFALTPLVPAAPVLILLGAALVLRVLARLEFARDTVGLLYVGVWVLALVSSQGRTGEWTTALTIALGALLIPRDELPQAIEGFAPRTGVLLVGASFAFVFLTLSNPWLRDLNLAAPLGAALALAAAFHLLRGKAQNGALVFAVLSALLLFASTSSDQTPLRALFVVGGGLVLCALCLRAAFQGHTLLLDLAVGGVLLLYAYLRVRLGWPVPGLAPIDLAVTLGGALLLVFLERGVRRARPAFVPSFLRYACALPLFALWTAPLDQRATVALGCALVFGLIAWLHRQDRASLLAAVAAIAFVNVSLLTTWVQRGVSDEQLYTIPLGFSLLVAAHISRGELQRQQLQWLRGLGCIVLYAGSALQIARSDGLMFPLVLGLLSLLTVAAGALLRVRVFLYFGLATLVLDVLANLLRYSARSRPVLAAVATGTGLLVIVVMTVLSVKRAQAVALYRRLVSTMEAWE